MYNRGWDVVRNTLLRHKVDTFKIIRPHSKMSDVKGQEGKDITIKVAPSIIEHQIITIGSK